MTITGLPQALSHEARCIERARHLRLCAHRVRSEDLRRRRSRAARRRNRRDRHALRLRHGGLLEEPRGDAKALRGGWLHTGDVGSLDARRLPHHPRPLEGHDHLRRLEHLSARDRGSAAAPSGGRRMLRRRPPACRMGRGGRRLCRLERQDLRQRSSIGSAWTTSRASSARANTASSTAFRRTTTARCSRPNCGSSLTP